APAGCVSTARTTAPQPAPYSPQSLPCARSKGTSKTHRAAQKANPPRTTHTGNAVSQWFPRSFSLCGSDYAGKLRQDYRIFKIYKTLSCKSCNILPSCLTILYLQERNNE